MTYAISNKHHNLAPLTLYAHLIFLKSQKFTDWGQENAVIEKPMIFLAGQNPMGQVPALSFVDEEGNSHVLTQVYFVVESFSPKF